jgi:hypothetical protein
MPGTEVVSLARVTRTSPSRLAACLLAGALTVLTGVFAPGAAAATRTAADQQPPLKVTIDTLTPSTVPAKGRVTMTGEITNTSQSTWTNLQVYMLRSTTPITSDSDLAAAAASDPATQVGTRLAGTGLYQDVGDLAPGQSTSYVLSVPRGQLGLSGAPGVYWFGVHVLGAENGYRDSVADGRARTFLPLVPPHNPGTQLSLIVPIRQPVRRDQDGQLIGMRQWQRLLGADGRLGRLLQLSSRGVNQPLTWVVDPAVLDAARSVAEQNPPLDTGATTGPGSSPSPSPSGSPSPSASPSASPSPGSPSANAGSTGAADAAAWLQMFQGQAGSHNVMTVPYGDLDVAAVMRNRIRGMLSEARRLSARTMAQLGVSASPVVAPDSGYLPELALRRLGPDTPLLLRDLALPEATGPVVPSPRGGPIVLTDTAAGTGGPNPTSRYSALAVRQRVLSEAALHALSPDRGRPLVVSTPQHWDPGPTWSQASFFEGLQVPWLTMVGLPSLIGGTVPGRTPEGLVYPRSELRAELPVENLRATRELARTGATFARVLSLNGTVDDQLAAVGLLASGIPARDERRAALARARATDQHVRALMSQIQVEGPPFVTMSSDQGPIQITVANGLDAEVTVEVHARTGTPDLHIASSDPITLAPGRRASIRLTAHAKDIGVHPVVLDVTDTAGHPLGSTARFNVRTSKVGLVIWVIMGAGGVVLLVAIVVRLLRRLSGRLGTAGPLRRRGNR